ncbi:MAG: putative penicillin-binding protein [Patescibacteria group bacterium]|nr:putative penicillin-binding protein [Patescibacteria group bacterium]
MILMTHHHSFSSKTPAKKGFWPWVRSHKSEILWGILSIFVIMVAALVIWIAFLKVPSLDEFTDRQISSSTKIYDRTGTIVLYDVHDNVKRTVVTSGEIAPIAKQAIVAIEDKDFYKHGGIEPKAIVRAAASQFLPFVKNSGGSTITQQLVKLTLLTNKQSITRKLKEWILAVKLDRMMGKDAILTTYLNEAPYGGTIYGIEEASEGFFGIHAADVDTAQAAYLAAIPNLPSYYSPYGSHKAQLDNRKNLVLKNLLDQGYITDEQYAAAKAEAVTFRPQIDTSGKALHFVQYIRDYLAAKYGEDAIASGLKVTTTLDWNLQQVAEKTIHDNAISNEKTYDASNSALVAIDPKTGQILAMVGSRGYSDRDIDGAFNVATAGRQPGSSFKPIVYSRAFEKGFQPETTVFDIPTQFGPCDAFDRSSVSPCYSPSDYDNKFKGPISLRDALGQSRNVPAVQLLSMIGLNDALATAKKLGITTLDRDASRYGLTLVLGGGEVTLLDMTSVYGTFANDGVRNPDTGILEVDDANGNVLEKFTPNSETVMDANATRKLASVLSDNVARTPLFGANSFFYFGGRQVAGKTGTTNNNKDAWVFGYTPSIAVGVWTGNNDNTPMKGGSSISGPAWRTFMDKALQVLPYDRPGAVETFPTADTDPDYDKLAPVLRGSWAGGESFWVDTVSGKLATDLTPPETKKEYVIPNPHNILYWINPANPKGSRPSDPASTSSQYNRWEAEFQNYLASHPEIVPGYPMRPTAYDDIHTEASKPIVTVTNISSGSTFNMTSQVTVQTTVAGLYSIQKLDYYLNGEFIGTSSNPNSFSFVPADNNAVTGPNDLKVVATDSIYNRGEYSGTINIQ